MLRHSWPAHSGQSSAPGCAAGVNFTLDGRGEVDGVGDGGGYGAIYCFAE